MMRAASGLAQAPIVFGRLTVSTIISARISPNNDTIIIMAARKIEVFENKFVIDFVVAIERRRKHFDLAGFYSL